MTNTLIIADDHPVFRAGLRYLLADLPELVLVAEATNGREAVELARQHQPAVMTMDLSMPELDGLGAIRELGRYCPGTRVLAVTALTSRSQLQLALDLGARALIQKGADGTELIQAIPRVLAGEIVVDPALQAQLAEPVAALTRRERQVLQRLALGENNAAVADHLGISASTVNNHRANLMAKLQVHSIAQLLAVALREGLVVPGEDG